MHFIIKNNLITNFLKIISTVVKVNSITGNGILWISVKEQDITLYGTNSDDSISILIKNEEGKLVIKKSGEICVKVQDVLNFVKCFDNEKLINVKVNNSSLELSLENNVSEETSKVSINLINPNESYNKEEIKLPATKTIINKTKLNSILLYMKPAISMTTGNGEFKNVVCAIKNNQMTLKSTNLNWFSINTIDVSSENEYKFGIELAKLQRIILSLTTEPNKDVYLNQTDKFLYIWVDLISIKCIAAPIRSFDISQILNQQPVLETTVGKINKINLNHFLVENNNQNFPDRNLLELKWEKNKILLELKGSATHFDQINDVETKPISITHDAIKVDINNFVDALKIYSKNEIETVNMNVHDESNALVIFDKDKNFIQVLALRS